MDHSDFRVQITKAEHLARLEGQRAAYRAQLRALKALCASHKELIQSMSREIELTKKVPPVLI
ncbi:MAG: hypothetical protein EOO38_00930 [Cytophagaceae bacterium]|nr:MAG: hypothetical protein EOO38_00930 [Cytophagaceae bacterium]